MLWLMLEIITPLQAKRELASGAEAYVVNLVPKDKETRDVRVIPIVDEFLEVFEELLGLSPSRKDDFSIEMELGIVPIHKSP